LADRAEFVRLPNDETSDEIPRFASVQNNSIAEERSCQYMVYRSVLLCAIL